MRELRSHTQTEVYDDWCCVGAGTVYRGGIEVAQAGMPTPRVVTAGGQVCHLVPIRTGALRLFSGSYIGV